MAHFDSPTGPAHHSPDGSRPFDSFGPPPFDEPGSDDPGWQVVSLGDPAGAGRDLAFTHGLAGLALPELLLWARPTEGLDPGADWLLTHRERARLLDRWAAEMISSRLTPGDEREVWFDGGDTAARFRFGAPIITSLVSHPFLIPGTPVVSIRWSMLRQAPTARPPDRVPEPVQRRLERWINAAEATTGAWRRQPGALGTDGGAGPGPDPRGLPIDGDLRSRWLATRCDQVLAAGSDVIGGFLRRLQLAEFARCGDCLHDEMLVLAGRFGRHPACRAASYRAQQLTLTLTGPAGRPSPSWQLIETGPWFTAGGLCDHAHREPDDRHEAAEPSGPDRRRLLSDGLEILLMCAALADVAPPAVIASATGPWEWAVSGGRVPGREWLARPAVRAAARAMLADATPDRLATAVEHVRASAYLLDAQTLDELVQGLRTTRPVNARPGALLTGRQRAGLPRSIRRGADALAEQLLVALAAPSAFTGEDRVLLERRLGRFAPTSFPIRTGPDGDGPAG